MKRKTACALCVVAMFALGCKREDGPPQALYPNSGGPAAPLVHRSISSGGHDRTYLLFAPASPTPLPLVIALHGRLGDGARNDQMTHFSKVAAREKFVLALPDGYKRSWNDARGTTPASSEGYDDVAFISDLIGELTVSKVVDPSRVYITGMSNGGMMAETLACKLPDKIAAIAIVGALLPVELTTCHPSHTMPVMMISGDHDPLMPYNGGAAGDRGVVKSADETARFWADAAGCAAPTDTLLPDDAPDDGTRTTWTHFGSCRDGAEVSLYRVLGGGHTWPGGLQYFGAWIIGKTSRDFDASERIWDFFKDKKR